MCLHLCLGLKFFTTFLHTNTNNDREEMVGSTKKCFPRLYRQYERVCWCYFCKWWRWMTLSTQQIISKLVRFNFQLLSFLHHCLFQITIHKNLIIIHDLKVKNICSSMIKSVKARSRVHTWGHLPLITKLRLSNCYMKLKSLFIFWGRLPFEENWDHLSYFV